MDRTPIAEQPSVEEWDRREEEIRNAVWLLVLDGGPYAWRSNEQIANGGLTRSDTAGAITSGLKYIEVTQPRTREYSDTRRKMRTSVTSKRWSEGNDDGFVWGKWRMVFSMKKAMRDHWYADRAHWRFLDHSCTPG